MTDVAGKVERVSCPGGWRSDDYFRFKSALFSVSSLVRSSLGFSRRWRKV